MKTLFFLIPDELHKQWKLKLATIGTTGKEVFLTFVQGFVREDKHGEKGKSKNKQDSKAA